MNLETVRLIGVLLLVFGVPPIAMIIGRRLERFTIRPDRFARSWLAEIGSDIRWLIVSLSFLAAITIASYPYFKPIIRIASVLLRVNLSVFSLLISIAAVSCLSSFLNHFILGSDFNRNDKRNLLTLLPIAISAIKLCIYFAFFLLLLASFDLSIHPFLEVGAIAAVILGLAGQNILADILSTLFIFTDRLFYMGDRLIVLCGEEWIEGTIIFITLRYTIIDRGDGRKLAIANRTLDKFQKLESLIDSNEQD